MKGKWISEEVSGCTTTNLHFHRFFGVAATESQDLVLDFIVAIKGQVDDGIGEIGSERFPKSGYFRKPTG